MGRSGEGTLNKIVPSEITEQENEVLNILAAAWNRFSALPVLHHADQDEMAKAIHAAQNIILARVGLRSTGVYRPDFLPNGIEEKE